MDNHQKRGRSDLFLVRSPQLAVDMVVLFYSASELEESTETWRPGSLETWKLGDLEAWKPGSLETWKLGDLEAWRPGSLET